MSLMCRLVVSDVYRQSSILSSISKMIPYQQLIICYSSKACDSGKSGEKSDKTDKSCSQSSSSGSDKKGGEGGGDPCEPCCTPCPPRPPSEDNPSSPTMYDLRKYGHSLPKNDVNVCFDPLPHIPTGIFRNTDCEILGLGAGKCCMYKNPEYFSFHHMTFYDMHLIMRCYRKPSPKTGRKP